MLNGHCDLFKRTVSPSVSGVFSQESLKRVLGGRIRSKVHCTRLVKRTEPLNLPKFKQIGFGIPPVCQRLFSTRSNTSSSLLPGRANIKVDPAVDQRRTLLAHALVDVSGTTFSSSDALKILEHIPLPVVSGMWVLYRRRLRFPSIWQALCLWR